MKEIIPIKKDIIFKTKIGKITNINLDHEYKVKDSVVEGNIILYGSYKMTEASVLEEDFNYKIPFGVAVVKNINKDSIKIDIDDFKYEVNKDVLNVNIDLEFTCDEITENISDENEEKDIISFNNDFKEESTNENKISTNIDSINNITKDIINSEKIYYTYKVYIVRENDTIESICSKYNVTINDINEYNDINEIKVGDKIIIPQVNEQDN